MKHYVHYAFTGTSVYSGTKESDTDAEFDSFEEAKASAIEKH